MTHGTPSDSTRESVVPGDRFVRPAGRVTCVSNEAESRRPRWVRVSMIGGVIVVGLLAAVLWFELQTEALVAAETAYRRNQLQAALRIAEGHLAWRPFCRPAVVLAARCLSRLGRPDDAERYYQKAGRLNVQDAHSAYSRSCSITAASRRSKLTAESLTVGRTTCWP